MTRPDGMDITHLEGEKITKARSRQIVDQSSLNEFYESKKQYGGAKSQGSVASGMYKMAFSPTPSSQKVKDKMLKVSCQSSKGRNVVLGDLILRFNEEGIATIPESKREALEVIQRARPGRFNLVEDSAPIAAVVAPVIEPVVAPKAETVVDLVVPPLVVKPEEVKPVVVVKNKKKGAVVKQVKLTEE